ncbi:MAG TPA: hypothetical protein PKJ33_00270 [Alphaproteobacteria bacterium]|nr:hypothetical protein [Alphaproteobacteria bacterium]
MKNTLMLGQIVWKKISLVSSVEDIKAAVDQTRKVLNANRVSLAAYKIDIPYQNSLFYLQNALRQKQKC